MALAPRLTVAEVAKLWGVHPSHVYREIRAGRLKALRFGRSLRLTPEQVEAYEATLCQNPDSQSLSSTDGSPPSGTSPIGKRDVHAAVLRAVKTG